MLTIKRFDAAKQRLAAGLDGERRRELAAAMAADVLEAIAAARAVERTIVVTGDPIAQGIAAEFDAEVVPDPADEGHVQAALAGIARAEADGAECVVLLPGDCPLLDPRELDRLLTGVPERYVAIVPDRHGEGTNSLVLRPPSAIVPSFGEGSRARHVDAARAAGIPFAVEEIPSLGLDLDTPADVIALTRELHGAPRPRQAHRPRPRGYERADSQASSRAVAGLPEIVEGMALGELIAERAGELADGDLVVVSQKVVSKAEGQVVPLHPAIPGAEARRLAAVLGKDPAMVELILQESRR